jgi:hypothetical protein
MGSPSDPSADVVGVRFFRLLRSVYGRLPAAKRPYAWLVFVGWAGLTAGLLTMIVGIIGSKWTQDGLHISRFSTTAVGGMVATVVALAVFPVGVSGLKRRQV